MEKIKTYQKITEDTYKIVEEVGTIDLQEIRDKIILLESIKLSQEQLKEVVTLAYRKKSLSSEIERLKALLLEIEEPKI